MRRLLAFALLAACTPTSYAFSPTVKAVTPKADNCPVDVVTSPPSRDFQEIGTLEFYNGTEPKTLDEFKKDVAKQVCQVGGDAVIAVMDDKGQFTKGTVIAYTGYGAPSPGSPPAQQMDNEQPK